VGPFEGNDRVRPPGLEQPVLQTHRLRLVAATADVAHAAAADGSRLANLLGVHVPRGWPPPLLTRTAQSFVADMLARRPETAGWWDWYILRRPQLPTDAEALIGITGFKGPPTRGNSVEVGYAIVDAFQRQGYATEAVTSLIRWAWRDARVHEVRAETYVDMIASMGVMEKCGMQRVGPGSEEQTVCYTIRRPSGG